MTNATLSVLVIDDEPDLCELLELTLRKMGLQVQTTHSVRQAKDYLAQQVFHLVLTDMRLPDGEGLEVVQFIANRELDIPVAVITAHGSAENAVAAMKAGAFDYLAKPVSLAQLRTLIKAGLQLETTGNVLVTQGTTRLQGQSAGMRDVQQLITKLARSQAAVYICGESGTGKEQAARQIHEQSPRQQGPFVAVNCGAIPDTLMESEFFGYRKGAFTGAERDRQGVFQQAHGGTLFLDEIADLPLNMQVKLLRAIQEKSIRPLGSQQEETVDVRIICATHKPLAEQVQQGAFRQDLYYRLNVLSLTMPPLRELREDIPLFVQTLLTRFSQPGEATPRLSEPSLHMLLRYHYPGNFRELENILERAVALASDTLIEPADLQLQPDMADNAEDAALRADGMPQEPLQDFLDRVEKDAIIKALEATRFNRTQAAKLLGVSFRSMRYRMERLGLK